MGRVIRSDGLAVPGFLQAFRQVRRGVATHGFHGQGSNALLHLDSLTQGSIPPPLTESRWKMETKHLMSQIIQSDFPVLDGQLDIHIYADDLDTAQLKQDLLMPLALSLGLLDEQGNMLSRFTVTVHHQFSSENGASHFSITSL